MEAGNAAAALLEFLKNLGVSVRANGCDLVITGPVERLTADLRHQIRLQKSELLGLLEPGKDDRAAFHVNEQNPSSLAIPVVSASTAGEWPEGCLAYPASFSQARLWFLHQLEPGLTAYHLPVVWRLRGELDVAALEQGLGGLIERHRTLRTSFQLQRNELLQIIHPPAPFHLMVEALGERDAGDVIREWLEQEIRRPFDLTAAVLLRARLLAVAEQEHVLLINHHHIASDGWSLSLLARDLTELYNARRSGRTSELAPLPVHYHDYAAWQRQRLSGDRLQTLKDYWLPQLTGLEPLEIPSDFPRPATPSHQGARVSFQITPELLSPFEQLCRLEGATLQMGLLALLALLLHRYSRQDDLAIGVPIWGRNHPDLEPLIGFFINTLPIRTRLTPQQSFRQLLQQVKATSLAAYDHQELPFEQMVEALNLPRDTSRTPLVQVMLQLIELPEASLNRLDGLQVTKQTGVGQASRFDLEFFLRRSSGGVEGTLVYATDLFSGDRIGRLSSHLLALLRAVLAAPDSLAASLSLLPDGEQLLIQSWQHGSIEEVPEICVHQLFELHVERTPDALALVFESEQLTYSELNQRANQLAHHLIDLGVGPEVIVAVCLERSLASVVSLLAILKAGGTYLPLDPHWPPERLQEIVLDSGALTSLIDSETTATVFSEATQIIHLPLLDLSEASTENPAFERSAPSNLAYILYTSGSTGKPKGTLVEHGTLNNLLHWSNRDERLSKPAKTLQFAANVFDVSLQEIFSALTTGGSLWLISEVARRDFRELYSLLLDKHIERLFIPYVALEQLSIYAAADMVKGGLKLRDIISAGEALILTEPIRRLLGLIPDCRLHNHYGPTESHVVTVYSDNTLLNASSDWVSIGRPIINTSIYLLDSFCQPCPIGVPGELHIGGAGLARGYLNNAELTADKFIRDPFSINPTARLYKSGDLASWNPDGTLAFHGRIDQQIKLRGFRIEPGEIEARLLTHPAVTQAVVLLRHDDPANPRLIAYWVADAAQPPLACTSSEELRSFLADRLPDYMVPAAFLQLQALPLTTNGKLDRKALPAPSFSGNLDQRVAPSSELECQLHAIWAEVLGHSDFGITDNFFAIGGHSLAAARLVSRIEQAIGCAPTLAALFQNPSIAGLTPLLSVSSAAAEAQPISAAGVIPDDWPPHCLAFTASFAQSRLWFLHQLHPELTAYHLPLLWRLRGELQVQSLNLALGELIERHPSLRTSFRLEGSEVLQIIHPPAPYSLEAEPLGDRDSEAVIEQWLAQEHATPFDLRSGLLIRARLLAVDRHEHLLLINHHHIASDGWSCSLLAREFTELYNAHQRGRSADLQPLAVHYPDYATWQRQRLSGDYLQQLKDYWIPQLTDLEPLEIPSDHPRPATPSHQGASVSFQITPELLAPFEQLCRLEGATLQMGLLALVALLLHRYSRQDDLAIGVPIWGRNHPDLEKLIGFFINTLPIRTRLAPQQSFRQLLQQVKATSLAAYDHQELPFEQMVEALNLPRDTSRNPLVQVMLQLIELPEASLQGLAELELEPLFSRPSAAKLDLEFYLRRTEQGGLRADVVYATELFDGERIERMGAHLLTLLASALEEPDANVDFLRLLPDAERQLIESWQDGPTIDVPDLCVHQLFEQQVERTPDAIALIFEDQQLTYADLNTCANALAQHQMDLGVGPGRIVAVCLERSQELVVSLLAILKAGGAYLPLDPSWPKERQQQLLKETGFSLLLTAATPELIQNALPTDASPSGPPMAYVSYTSGSTGVPKGVAVSHAAILRLVHPVNGFLLGEGQRVLQLAPVAFDASTLEIWGPLLNGGTLVIAPAGQLTLQELAGVLRQERISTLWLTAGLFHTMVENELEALAGVRQVLAGGDVLSPAHVQRLLDAFSPGHELINGYGPTENTTFTCCHRLAAGERVDPAGMPIGRPIAMTTVQALERSGQPCPIGIAGELHIGGAGLARGYLHHPELTAEKFVANLLSSDPRDRLYKSGDLVSWNADGTLAFHGRLDQQFKLRGFRIEPGEIEAHLLTHPAVAQAVVVLHHDDPDNPRLTAYWVVDASQPPLASTISGQLRAFLADRLPEYMVPAVFLQLEALPLTTNGKLDRKALPAPSFSGNLEQRVEPSTDLERQLHGIWAEVLGHSDFGIHDNFFLVGGHSLAVARLVSRLEQAFASAPSLAALFQAPTVAAQVQLIQAPLFSDTPSLVTLQPHGERAPLLVIHGWGGEVWGFIPLARALAPARPVYGVRAIASDDGGPQPGSVREMAADYAEQILRQRPTGVIHLLGFSAGGWYAYAVAEALLQRGAPIGMLAVLDTGATTRIHRRLGMVLLLRRLSARFGTHLGSLLRLSKGESRLRYLQGRLQGLNDLLAKNLHVRVGKPLPSQPPSPTTSVRVSDQEKPAGDRYAELLYQTYRPQRLSLRVAIFAPEARMKILQRIWRFYAREGLSLHPIFADHFDFIQAERVGELAHALEAALEDLEEAEA